jgi:hypothetical protein
MLGIGICLVKYVLPIFGKRFATDDAQTQLVNVNVLRLLQTV